MTVCICKEIQCPYFNEKSNGFGCQMYNVASICHLVRQFEIENKTQYGLYAKDEDDLDLLRIANKAFFLNNEKYQDDLKFVTKNADWIKGWKVRPLPE